MVIVHVNPPETLATRGTVLCDLNKLTAWYFKKYDGKIIALLQASDG